MITKSYDLSSALDIGILSYGMETEFLNKVFEAMVLLAICDGELHPAEHAVIKDFIEKHKIQSSCSLPRIGPISGLDQKSVLEQISAICDQCHTDAEKLFLLDRLSQVADADLNLNQNEIEIVNVIQERWNIGIAFTKQKIKWSKKQQEIIDLEPSERTIVSAPPGSGKTAVIVAKLDKMIRDYHLEPSNIWLISFTRTAVREMNDRVILQEAMMPKGLRIATLDSSAFSMNFSIGSIDRQVLDYEQNIDTFLELLLKKDPDLIDFLSNLEHLIIDESQDFVGSRRDVIVELVKSLELDCGVTILGDELQQIYGQWANRDSSDLTNLMDYLKADVTLDFDYKELTEIHRTESRELLELIEDLRLDLSLVTSSEEEDYARRRQLILDRVERATPLFKNYELSENHLVLFRNRSEVVDATVKLVSRDTRFKLRLPQYPRYMSPWVHSVFEYSRDQEKEFLLKEDVNLITEGLSLRDKKYLNTELAWDTLMRYSASEQASVSVDRLRVTLSRGSRVPVEFTNPEFGFSGPVLSTVHSSKGRESKSVIFNLPGAKISSSKDGNEESRVLLVGASRAKDRLQVSSFPSNKAAWKYSRYFDRYHRLIDVPKLKNPFMMELGLEDDYDPYSCVSRETGYSEAVKTQDFLRNLHPLANTAVCVARRSPTSLIYNIEAEWMGEKYHLGSFKPQVHDALKAASRQLFGVSKHPPLSLHNIKIIDVATHVSARDDDLADKVLIPFHKKGAWLYPVLFGIGPFVAANF